MGSTENQSRVLSIISQAVCVWDAMETDTPRHQRTSLGGTNDLTAGRERGSSEQGEHCHPQGFLLIPYNALPKLSLADATYFSIRQSKDPFSGLFSCLMQVWLC